MLTRFRKYRCGLNLLFHGWQQLKEADRDLPKIVRKSGPHHVIFQMDEHNLMELKPVISLSLRYKTLQRHATTPCSYTFKNDAKMVTLCQHSWLNPLVELKTYLTTITMTCMSNVR